MSNFKIQGRDPYIVNDELWQLRKDALRKRDQEAAWHLIQLQGGDSETLAPQNMEK